MEIENEIIIKTIEKNRVAENKLFKYTKSKIKKYLNNYYPNNNVEDDVSDIVIKIFEKLNKYNPKKSKYSTWIINVAKNHMIDKSRLYCNNVRFYSTSTDTENNCLNVICTNTGGNITYNFLEDNTLASSFEDKDTLTTITSTFTSADQSLLLMKYSSGYNYLEIGKEMNMDKSEVSNRVNYLKKKIKKRGV